MSIRVTLLTCALTCSVALAGEAKFAGKPVAKKANGKTTISFTASAATDAEVSVLDAKGKVVRHLAAGVLGGKKAPPAPLKAGLSQSLEWDGRTDTGKKAAGGPFKVRVRLGLKAELDGYIGESKYWIGQLCGLATDPKGNLYVYSSSVHVHRGSSRYMQVFNRKGEYLRTIMPMPANLPKEKLLLFNTTSRRGKKTVLDVPGKHFYPRNYFGTWPELYPGPVGQLVRAVTADGIVTISDGFSIARIRNDGGAVGEVFWRPLWPADRKKRPGYRSSIGPRHLVPSPDGKKLYMTGICNKLTLGKNPELKVDPNFPDGRVYRMDLTKPGATMEKFVDLPHPANVRKFSEVKAGYRAVDYHTALHSGVDRACCDKDGNLLVCDRMNGMIRVYSPAGKELGGFKVELPENVAIHSKTGAVYVTTNRFVGNRRVAKKLLKFSSWEKDARLLAEYEFPSQKGRTASMALDDSAEPPVIWAAGDLVGKRCLLRIEDRGAKFALTANLLDLNKDRFGVKPRLAVHPETDLVICNDGAATLNGYDGLSGKQVKLPFEYGADMAVGLDGNWYIQTGKSYSGYICRYDKNLKPIPVKEPPTGGYKGTAGARKGEKAIPNALGFVYGRMGAGFCTVGTATDPRGRVYSMQMYGWSPYCVAVYGPDGKAEDPGRLKDDPKMQKAGRFKSALVGPIHTVPGGLQLDWGGNIYIGLALRPVGYSPPAGFEKDPGYNSCAGSVVKFGPEGAAIIRLGAKKGQAAEPPAGKKGLVLYHHKYGRGPRFLENATRAYPELGCLSGSYGDGCMCRQPMFQVDGWGRLFIPNAITCSVRIVDNAGNFIQQFGHYGNIDSRGLPRRPASETSEASAKEVGPGEESLIKTPAVPLGWPEAVGASYKAVYVSDVLNRRIVRFKKVYAAEETCTVK